MSDSSFGLATCCLRGAAKVVQRAAVCLCTSQGFIGRVWVCCVEVCAALCDEDSSHS